MSMHSSPPKGQPEGSVRNEPPSLLKRSSQSYGIMGAIGLFTCAFLHQNLQAILSLPGSHEEWRYFGLLVVLATGIVFACQELCKHLFSSYESQRNIMGQIIGPLTLSQALYLTGISALAEELLFRGAIQPYLGVLSTSMVLAILHVTPHGIVSPLMLLSLITSLTLGLIFQYAKSLYPGLLIHLLLNGSFLIRHALQFRSLPAEVGRENHREGDSPS